MNQDSQISIAIPTFNRGRILLQTIEYLTKLPEQANEILVVDQTFRHPEDVQSKLDALSAGGEIRYFKLETPSITRAMNFALQSGEYPLILFLDDDIVPTNGLVEAHQVQHSEQPDLWATVGQVIQPWQKPESILAPRKKNGLTADFDFPFHSTIDAYVENVMAGNLCVNRDRALSIGGFDENFIGVAYRFETDFARRVIRAGGKIRFVASAGIEHLHAESGGTRSQGNHMKSASPLHGFGDYYYAFKHGKPFKAWKYSLNRMFREVRTKFHLTHPWWIPVKVVGESRAIIMARQRVGRMQACHEFERRNN